MIRQFWIHIPAAILVFFSVFYLSILVHFPTQALEERIEYEVQNQTKQSFFLEIGSTKIGGIGLKMNDIKLLQKERKAKEAEFLLGADNLNISMPFLSLLTMSPSANVSSSIFGGEIDISANQDGKEFVQLQSKISDMNLALLPTKGAAWSLDLLGQIQLASELRFPLKRFSKAKGEMSLSIQKAKLEEGTILIKTLPSVAFKEVSLDLKFDKGKASVTKGIIESDELSAAIEGYIKLSNQPLKSKLFLKIKITTGEEIDKLLGSLATPYKAEDGSYSLKVIGSLQSPRVQAVTARKKRNSRSNRPPRNSPNRDTPPAGKTVSSEINLDAEDEAAKRRKERLDRAKKRRENRLKALDKGHLDKIKPLNKLAPSKASMLNFDGIEEESDDEEEEGEGEGEASEEEGEASEEEEE